jgi:hypothetical protein
MRAPSLVATAGAPEPSHRRGVAVEHDRRELVRALAILCVAQADLRRVAAIGRAGVAALGLIGLVAFRRPGIDILELLDVRDMRLTVPSLVSGGLLLAAAALCLLLDVPAHAAGSAERRIAPWLLALLCAGEAGRLQERAADVTGGAAVWAAVALLVGVAACEVVAVFSRGWARYLLAAGATVWAAAHVASALASRSAWLDFAGQFLDIVAAALIAMAVLVVVQGELLRGAAETWARSRWTAAMRVIASLTPGRVAVVLTSCSAAFLVLGWLVEVEHVPIQVVDPRGELGFPAWFDVTMLLSAPGLVLLLGHLGDGGRWRLLMAAVFVTLAIDELISIHETVGGRLGLAGEGQLVFAPLIVVAFAAWSMTLRRVWPLPPARALFIGGAVVWVTSQSIDVYYGGLRPETTISVVIEDVLEGWGSALFLLALLLGVQAAMRQDPLKHVIRVSDQQR